MIIAYTAVISAVDSSGRTADKATCTALVLKMNNMDPLPDISSSSQRFLLTEYTSIFTDYDYQARTSDPLKEYPWGWGG